MEWIEWSLVLALERSNRYHHESIVNDISEPGILQQGSNTYLLTWKSEFRILLAENTRSRMGNLKTCEGGTLYYDHCRGYLIRWMKEEAQRTSS